MAQHKIMNKSLTLYSKNVYSQSATPMYLKCKNDLIHQYLSHSNLLKTASIEMNKLKSFRRHSSHWHKISPEAMGYFQQLLAVTQILWLPLLVQVCNNLQGKLLPNFLDECSGFLKTEACNPLSLVMLFL